MTAATAHGEPASPATSASVPRPAPVVALVVLAALATAVTWSVAVARTWGDIGVTADGVLHTGPPWPALTVLGAAAVGSVAGAALMVRRPGAAVLTAGVVVLLLASAGLVLVNGVLDAQDFPHDGGAFGRATARCALVDGLVLLVGAFVPRRRSLRALTVLVAAAGVLVVAATLVAAGTAAPGWPDRRTTGRYPAAFSEDPGPTSVSRVGWQVTVGADTLATVLGGRIVTAQDITPEGAGGCHVEVRGLDAGRGQEIWSSDRPVRCDGPRLARVDGDGQVVRVTLRASSRSGAQVTGPAVAFFLDLESGRPLDPGPAASQVVAWTEGFGIGISGDTVSGIVPRTGSTAWTRPTPRCPDGTVATVGVADDGRAGDPAARSPYDGGRPPGAVPVVQSGRTVVLGWSCAGARHAWLIDTSGDGPGDRTVELPSTGRSSVPTSFVAGLTDLVVAVPAGDAPGDGTALLGVDPAAGKVTWQRPVGTVSTLGVVPSTGDVAVSSAADATLLDASSGAVLRTTRMSSPVVAALELVGTRVLVTAGGDVEVVDATSGALRASFAVPGCRVDPAAVEAPLSAGPGGVALRCASTGAEPLHLVGLVP